MQRITLALNTPPRWAYLMCWPLWRRMRDPGAFAATWHYKGEWSDTAGFSSPLFGAALTVGIARMLQMGEQAD
jgi:hypothetical protein